MYGSRKIQSISSLRGIAIIGIFLSHAHSRISWPYLGVSLFFVMSGFLLTKKYIGTDDVVLPENNRVRYSIVYGVRRIAPLYPLHIITMLLSVWSIAKSYIVTGTDTEHIKILMRDIICNVLLIQSWWPDAAVNVSLNGVAWYLSSALFTYCMFPLIITKIRQHKDDLQVIFPKVIAIVIITQVLVSYIGYIWDPSWSFYRWLTYDAPFFRLGDFISGCMLGAVITEKSDKGEWELLELIVIILSIFMVYWDFCISYDSIIAGVINNWTTVWMLFAMVFLWGFYYEMGYIFKVLGNSRILSYIGDNSRYYFLIHYTVIAYIDVIKGWFHIDAQLAGTIALEAALTVVFSIIYKKIEAVVMR